MSIDLQEHDAAFLALQPERECPALRPAGEQQQPAFQIVLELGQAQLRRRPELSIGEARAAFGKRALDQEDRETAGNAI